MTRGLRINNNENARSINIAKRQNQILKNPSKAKAAIAITSLAQTHSGIGSGNPYDKMLYRGK